MDWREGERERSGVQNFATAREEVAAVGNGVNATGQGGGTT